MNFLTASVDIKVDDSKLLSQLAKAKSAVTKTVDKIKTSFSKMAVSFKAAFDKIVRYAKWGALTVAGALTLMTRAAMKQEDAQFLLMSALKISGEYTKELEERFKAFAASVQQATIYGDEEVLALMQLQKSLGVTADKLELAAKQAIGLATATGRDIRSMSMYIALAQQGEFTMLRRYIPALRSTTDETEQLKIITEFAAAGFKLAEERAKTASGGLRQMWNALGDVAEVIGGALLPTIKDTSKEIKEWAERNQERIGKWANKVVGYIGDVINKLRDIVSYIKKDWRKGLKAGLDISLELFKGFGKSVEIILKSSAINAFNAFAQAFGDRFGRWLIESSAIMEKGKLGILAKYPLTGAARIQMMKAGTALMERSMEPPSPAIDTSARLIGVWKDVYKKIEEIDLTSKKTIKEQYADALRAKIAMIDEELAANRRKTEEILQGSEKITKAIDTTKDAFEESTVKLTEYGKGIRQMFKRIEYAIGDTLQAMMEGTMTFKEGVKQVFRDITRSIMQMIADMAARWIMFQALTGMGMNVALMGMAPMVPGPTTTTAFTSPHGGPALQQGGLVEKTGWAKVHKGETFSGVGGGKPIRFDFHIHHEGERELEMTSADVEPDMDGYVVKIMLKDSERHGPFSQSLESRFRRT